MFLSVGLIVKSLTFFLLVPLMPLSLLVNSHGTSVLMAQWKAPAGQRDSYMVSVSEEGMPDTRNHMAVEKTSTNVTLTGLTPGTCYLAAVWSLAGPYSSVSRNGTACTGECRAISRAEVEGKKCCILDKKHA